MENKIIIPLALLLFVTYSFASIFEERERDEEALEMVANNDFVFLTKTIKSNIRDAGYNTKRIFYGLKSRTKKIDEIKNNTKKYGCLIVIKEGRHKVGPTWITSFLDLEFGKIHPKHLEGMAINESNTIRICPYEAKLQILDVLKGDDSLAGKTLILKVYIQDGGYSPRISDRIKFVATGIIKAFGVNNIKETEDPNEYKATLTDYAIYNDWDFGTKSYPTKEFFDVVEKVISQEKKNDRKNKSGIIKKIMEWF